jgi:hypothetical protein
MFRKTISYFIENWPDMSALILVVLSAILAIFPGWVVDQEKKSNFWRIGIPSLVLLVGISGFVRGISQKRAFQGQINTLTTGVLAEATKDDINSLRNDIKALTAHIDDGFSRVIDAIKGLPPKQAIPERPRPPEKPTGGQLPPAILEHLQIAQRRVPSTKPESPYGLQVVIQTDTTVENTGLELDFDGEIDEGDFFIAGQGAMMLVRSRLTPDRKGYIFGFEYPNWTPDHPIVATILSKQSVQTIGVRKVHF